MSKLWLPPGLNPSKESTSADDRFTEELMGLCKKHRCQAMMIYYHLESQPKDTNGRLVAGNAFVEWYDKGWQALREKVSQLFVQGHLKRKSGGR